MTTSTALRFVLNPVSIEVDHYRQEGIHQASLSFSFYKKCLEIHGPSLLFAFAMRVSDDDSIRAILGMGIIVMPYKTRTLNCQKRLLVIV